MVEDSPNNKKVTDLNVREVLKDLPLDGDLGLVSLFGECYGEFKFGRFTYQIYHDGMNFFQLNTCTGKKRKIYREVTNSKPNANDVLYGQKSTISIVNFLNKFSKIDVQGEEIKSEKNEIVDKMAKLMSDASGMKYNYWNSEMFLKPAAFRQWLLIASERGYTHVRLVKHCGNQKTYKGVAKDPTGLHCEFAGTCVGQKYGPGLYFGLSDTISSKFNDSFENPDGTGIMCLVLCNEELCTSTRTNSGKHGGIESFCWHGHSGHDDAIRVLSSELVLPLGLARAI